MRRESLLILSSRSKGMLSLLTVFCLLLVPLQCFVRADDIGSIDCTFTDANGKFYDLSDLARSDDDYSIQTDSTPSLMVWFNLCRKMVTQPGWYGATESSDGAFNSIGIQQQLSNLPAFDEEGATFKMTDGISCSGSPYNGKTYGLVYARCDSSASVPVLSSVKIIGNCGFSVEMTSASACPTTKSGKGWVFIMVFFLVAGVYFIGGAVYRVHWKQKELSKACPHRKFWRKLPGLVLDGCKYSAKNCVCLCGVHIELGNSESEPLTA